MSTEGTDKRVSSQHPQNGDGHGDLIHGDVQINGYFGRPGHAGASDTAYRALFDAAPVGYFTLSREGAIRDANLMGAKQLRTQRDDLVGSCFYNYVAANDNKRFDDHLRKVFSSTSTQTCELDLIAPDNAKRCLQLQSVLSHESAGEPLAYVVTTDVSERRKKEEAERFLAEATNRLAQSIDYHTTLAQLARMCVPYLADWCTVFIIERDGSIERLATAHADPVKEEIAQELQHRYPPGRNNPFAIPVLRGETVLIPELDEAKIVATTQNEEHRQLVLRLGPKSMMVMPLMLRGRVLGALSLMTTGVHPPYNMNDVEMATRLADRAAMPVENARLYLEAQEAVKARDEFLSIASHELRTPLTSLNLQLQGLLKSIQTEGLRNLPQDRVKRRLHGAHEQVQRMVDLVNRLLDVSRITAERIELDVENINLVGLVGEVLDRFDLELRTAGCHLTFDMLDHPVVSADRFRLDQVVTNLVSNAIKYGRGNPISVVVDCKDGKAVLSIEDRGMGISSENMDRIFERFERASGSYSITGLGLGLYISKRLIEAMSGSISVSSKIDVGSKFTIELPSPS